MSVVISNEGAGLEVPDGPDDYPYARQIEDIIEQLDDHKIALTMDELDIKWAGVRGGEPGRYEPSRAQIRAHVRRMLADIAAREAAVAVASHGGFVVVKMGDRVGAYFAPFHAETFNEEPCGYTEPTAFVGQS